MPADPRQEGLVAHDCYEKAIADLDCSLLPPDEEVRKYKGYLRRNAASIEKLVGPEPNQLTFDTETGRSALRRQLNSEDAAVRKEAVDMPCRPRIEGKEWAEVAVW